MLKFPGKSKFTCSGSIVGKKWILTAGNCADKSVEGFPTVFFGNPNINSMIDGKVKKVHKHSKFDQIDVNFLNDLALVEMEKEIDFNDKVHKICIIKNLKENKKEIAVFAGFGDPFYYIKNKDLVKKNGSELILKNDQKKSIVSEVIDLDDLFTRPAESLQETPIALQPWEECKMALKNSTINKKTVCGGKTAHGTTKGDAGGPLMLIRNKKWTLFGIASTGRYESIQDDRLAMDHFGLYTKVGDYCDWLETTTKKEVKCLVS